MILSEFRAKFLLDTRDWKVCPSVFSLQLLYFHVLLMDPHLAKIECPVIGEWSEQYLDFGAGEFGQPVRTMPGRPLNCMRSRATVLHVAI